MNELLSLKWNNHRNAFYNQLSTLRQQDSLSDVTLACEGNLYNVHKIVLSTCSKYFNLIFQTLAYNNTVIILKDISCKNLESLLDYMYLGEANVNKNELHALIQAAECLKLKGLAVQEDNDHYTKQMPQIWKCSEVENLPCGNKKRKTSHIETALESSLNASESENIKLPKRSVSPNDIKEEIVCETDYNYSHNFDEKCDIDGNIPNRDEISLQDDNSNNYEPFSYPGPSSYSYFEDDRSNDNLDIDTSQSTSNVTCDPLCPPIQKTQNKPGKHPCPFCDKCFRVPFEVKRHIRTHTGEKPFGCPHCSLKANQKHHLFAHMAHTHKDFSRECLMLGLQ